MKILILGVNGMLGRMVFRLFSKLKAYKVKGTLRNEQGLTAIPDALKPNVEIINALDSDERLMKLFSWQPNVVINCIGVIKQLTEAKDPLITLPINSLFPHRLKALCASHGSRLIHISTDCVFTGKKGNYVESDEPDARDLYGLSKYLGEINSANAITLRTSIIGHENGSCHSLLEWFLSQKGAVSGFSRAIFSGLPVNELARVIRDYVIPNPELTGLYHVSAEAINKYNLLKLVAEVYNKKIEVKESSQLVIDRSLNSQHFRRVTGYQPPDWTYLIESLYHDQF